RVGLARLVHVGPVVGVHGLAAEERLRGLLLGEAVGLGSDDAVLVGVDEGLEALAGLIGVELGGPAVLADDLAAPAVDELGGLHRESLVLAQLHVQAVDVGLLGGATRLDQSVPVRRGLGLEVRAVIEELRVG